MSTVGLVHWNPTCEPILETLLRTPPVKCYIDNTVLFYTDVQCYKQLEINIACLSFPHHFELYIFKICLS